MEGEGQRPDLVPISSRSRYRSDKANAQNRKLDAFKSLEFEGSSNRIAALSSIDMLTHRKFIDASIHLFSF